MLTAMFWSFALLVTLASVVCGEVVYDVELLKAGEHGFANRIDSIINHGACVEVKNNFGVTPLIWAANNNHLETMKALINRGADVEAKANNGRTPIMWAATWGHVAIAEHLLSVGAKIDTADKEGLTALLLAVMNNHVEMVRLLLKSGADTNVVTSQGGTIFTIAAAKNNQDILNALACNRKNAGLGTCSSNDGTCEDELQSLSQRKHAGNHEQAGDLSIFFQIYAVLRIYGSFIVDLFSAIYMSARNGDLFVIPQFRKQDFDTLISSLPGFFNLPVVQYIIGLSVVSTLLHLLLPFIWNVVIDQALDKALELTDPKNRNKNKKKNGINRLHNSSLDFGELDIDPSVPQHSRNHDREQFKSPKELQTALESPKYNYNSNSKAVVMDLLAELRPTLVMTIPFLSSIPNSKVHSMLAKAMQSEVRLFEDVLYRGGDAGTLLRFVTGGSVVCGLSDEPKLISMPHYRLTKYKHSVLGGEHTAGMHLGECCLISPAGVLVQSATVKSPSAELQSISRDDLWVILRQLKATEREKLLLKLLITCGKRDVIPAAALCTITAIKQCLTAEQKKLLQYVDTTETAQLKGLFQSINALLHGINDHCQCYFDVTDSDFDPSHVSPTKV